MPPADILGQPEGSPDQNNPSSIMMASALVMERSINNIATHMASFGEALELATTQVDKFRESLERAVGAIGGGGGGYGGNSGGGIGVRPFGATDYEHGQAILEDNRRSEARAAQEISGKKWDAEHPDFLQAVFKGNSPQWNGNPYDKQALDNPAFRMGVSGIGYGAATANISNVEDSGTLGKIFGKFADQTMASLEKQQALGTNGAAIIGTGYAMYNAVNELQEAANTDMRSASMRSALSTPGGDTSWFGANDALRRTRSSGRMFKGISEQEQWAAQGALAGTGALDYESIQRWVSPYAEEVNTSGGNPRNSMIEMMGYTGLSSQAITGAGASGAQTFGAGGFEGSKDSIMERLAIAKNLGVSQESLAKLSDSLVASLRPVISGFEDVTPLLGDFAQDLVHGRVSLQGITAVMGQASGMGNVNDQVSNMVLGGKEISHLPGVAAAQSMMGTRPLKASAMMRQAMGTWSPEIKREFMQIMDAKRGSTFGFDDDERDEAGVLQGGMGGMTAALGAGSPAESSIRSKAIRDADGKNSVLSAAADAAGKDNMRNFLLSQHSLQAGTFEVAAQAIDVLGSAAGGAGAAIVYMKDALYAAVFGTTPPAAPRPGQQNTAAQSPTGAQAGAIVPIPPNDAAQRRAYSNGPNPNPNP